MTHQGVFNILALVKDLVTTVSQAVLYDATYFLVGGTGTFGAANDRTHPRTSRCPGAIAGYRTNQTADDCAAGSASAGLLIYLFGNLFALRQVDFVLFHIDTGGVDDGLAFPGTTSGNHNTK
jgi:hypothetical protein